MGTWPTTYRTIVELPPGYLPAHRVVHPALVDQQPGRVDIHPLGSVTIELPASPSGGGKDYVSLDGISFRAAP